MLDFEKLFQDNQSFIFRYLVKLCGNESLAEELTQETFFRAYMNLTGLRREEKVTVWLCQIAKHTYYQYVDKQKKQPAFLEQQPGPSIEQMLVAQEDKIELYRLIHQLHEPYREILHLRLLGGLSFQEIGEILGKNETWARVTFYRVKQKIMKGVN